MSSARKVNVSHPDCKIGGNNQDRGEVFSVSVGVEKVEDEGESKWGQRDN